MDLMFTSPYNSYIKILKPNVVVFGGAAFEGHEGRALLKGFIARRASRTCSFCSLSCDAIQRR